jgi:hypothetical protein
MPHVAGDAGAIAWANGVDATVAGKLDTTVASSTYARLVERYSGRNLYIYGNSYAIGTGASLTSLDFTTLLAAELDMTEINRAVGGEQTYQTLNRAMSDPDSTRTLTVPTDAGLFVFCSAINDVRRDGVVQAGVLLSTHSLHALIALVSAEARIEETAFTFTGAGWSAPVAAGGDYRFSGGFGRYTETLNEYVECAFSGDAITNYGFAFPGTTRSLTVEYKVDGVAVRTVNYANDRSPAATGREWPRFAERLSGFGPGAHTLRVTKTAGVDAMWVDLMTQPALNPPPIVIVPPLPLAVYTADAPFNNGSDAAVALNVRQLGGIAAAYKNVRVAAVAWNPATMIAGDTVHPNDLGHAAISAAVRDAALQLAYVA